MKTKLNKETIPQTTTTDEIMVVDSNTIEENVSSIENYLQRGGKLIIRRELTSDDIVALGNSPSTWQPQNLITNQATLSPTRIVQSISGDGDKTEGEWDRERINTEAWIKYVQDAFVSTSIDRLVGRIVGHGFKICSHIVEIQDWLDEVFDNPLNELYSAFQGYVVRKLVENELFLNFTVHDDGFSEIDVIEPSLIVGGNNTICSNGVVVHPTKRTMPLWYRVKVPTNLGQSSEHILIPSSYIAYMPELNSVYSRNQLESLGARIIPINEKIKDKSKGKLLYNRYVLSWRSSVKELRRNVSRLRTLFEPLEDYKQVKRWRSDYMKALATYFIFFEFEDLKSWLRWLALSPEEKRNTGITQPLRPADRLLLPPGIKATIQNPQLPKMSGDDQDLLKWMATAANTPYDVFSSDVQGATYASSKASRPFYMDYIDDLQGMTEIFFKEDFCKLIFHFKIALDRKFKAKYPMKKCVDFVNKKPVFEEKKYPPHKFISIIFPQSQEINTTDTANAYLGSKRGDLTWHLGASKKMIATKLGIPDYESELRRRAEEEDKYPDEFVSNQGNSDMVDSLTTKTTDLENKSGKIKGEGRIARKTNKQNTTQKGEEQ